MKTASPHMPLQGSWQAWAMAAACTLTLNLALFSAIPWLMKHEGPTPALGPMIPQIQLTRLRRPDPERPEPKEPSKPKATPLEKLAPPRQASRPLPRAMTLPFTVNTRLPGGPKTLALPDVMTGALEALNLTGLFAPGDLDHPLTVISRIPPMYPFKAKTRGIEGWVSVAFTVNEQGLVQDIEILDADPENLFDDSVIQCLSAWRFKPGRIRGETVKTRVKTKIRFELN